MLRELGKSKGSLGSIFQNSQNKIRNTSTLRELIDLIGHYDWSAVGTGIHGNAYEALLERGAEDVKSGVGQYSTPRALIQAIVDCVQPHPDDTIIDPACGTGGFLPAAHDYIQHHYGDQLTAEQRAHLKHGGILGTEPVHGAARLARMNLLLHGIGGVHGPGTIAMHDSLAEQPTTHATLVLANPPFGRKSGLTSVDENGRLVHVARNRADFWVRTTDESINFVQHIYAMLQRGGRAAVIVPDNVLFNGGAGKEVRLRLLKHCDLHTMLRLPTGIFYAGGVKANVLFFEKKQAAERPWTERLWVYDFRTGQNLTLRQNPLTRTHLDDFVRAFMPGEPRSTREETERFKAFTYDEIVARDKANPDITWLRDPALELRGEAAAAEIGHNRSSMTCRPY